MTLEHTRKVSPDDVHPEAPGKCGDCRSELGSDHKPDCFRFKKTVVARISFDVLLEVANSNTPEDMEEFWNESSSCSSNRLIKLEEQLEKVREQSNRMGGCPCPFTETKFLRDATTEDHQHFSGEDHDV